MQNIIYKYGKCTKFSVIWRKLKKILKKHVSFASFLVYFMFDLRLSVVFNSGYKTDFWLKHEPKHLQLLNHTAQIRSLEKEKNCSVWLSLHTGVYAIPLSSGVCNNYLPYLLLVPQRNHINIFERIRL
jgi:hypothetical protein